LRARAHVAVAAGHEGTVPIPLGGAASPREIDSMKAVSVLACAFVGVSLSAALSVHPVSKGHRGISTLELGEVAANASAVVGTSEEMITVPSGSVLGVMSRHLLVSAEARKEPIYVGDPPPKHSVVITRSQYWILVASYVALWSAAVFLIGWLYIRQKIWAPVDPEVVGADLKRFSSGPFNCLDDMNIFLWTFLCPCIRWADNVSMLDLLGFWPALAVMTLVMIMYSLTGYVIIAALSAMVWTHYRQRMRQMFDMEGQYECAYYSSDCLLYFACMPCAIAQEARHLELAARAGHEAVEKQRPADA